MSTCFGISMARAVLAPVEWVPGRPRALWYAGFFGLPVVVLVLWAVAVQQLVALTDPGSLNPVYDNRMTIGLSALGPLVVVLQLLLYTGIYPMPAGWLAIGPGGLAHLGNRATAVPWDRLHRVGRRLYAFSPRFGWPSWYALEPNQVDRFDYFEGIGRCAARAPSSGLPQPLRPGVSEGPNTVV